MLLLYRLHIYVCIVYSFIWFAGQFPTSEGSLAPGIACTYIVTFCPDSIATFDDCLQVSCGRGLTDYSNRIKILYRSLVMRVYVSVFPY